MAKIIFEFDIYEDKDAVHQYIHTVEAFALLENIKSRIRWRIKNHELDDETKAFLNDVAGDIHELVIKIE